jgi:hypothetical protein
VKHERATEETRQQAALYALGLLAQHEAHCFERHMGDCPVCRTEFAKLLFASAQIGLAVKEERPADDLRKRLSARIDSSNRPRPLSDPQKHQFIPPGKNPEPLRKNPSVPAPKAPAPVAQPRSGKTAFIVNAIVYVLLAALAAFTFYLWRSAGQENIRLHNRMELSENEIADLLKRLDSQQENTAKLEKFKEMFDIPFLRVIPLEGQPAAPYSTGAVLWDSLAGDITVLGVFNPAPAGMVYRLWFSSAYEKISLGPLPSDKNGHIFTSIKLKQGMSADTSVMAIITLESSSDLAARVEPAEPWIAAGRAE